MGFVGHVSTLRHAILLECKGDVAKKGERIVKQLAFLILTRKYQAMGMRQHHCRLCGAAVCAACSKQRQKHPRMGYELPVRICDTCARQRAQMQQDQPDKWERRCVIYHFVCSANNLFVHSQRAMAVPFDTTGLGVVACSFNETTNRLATVGNDRVVKVWDAKPVLGIK